MNENERKHQPGNVIIIRKEPPKARRYGFFIGTEHEVIPPPENNTPTMNSSMGVWVKSKNNEPKYLQFMYWNWLGKVAKTGRTRLNRFK